MNADTFQRITTRNDIARDIIAGFAVGDADADGRLPARGSRARRRARRARRPRTGTGRTRGGAAGPGEPARRDPGLPRGGRRRRGRPARLPARRTRHDRYPGDGHQAAAMTSYRQMRRQRTPRPPRRAAADHGHQHRRPVPHPGRRGPRPRRVAVPFRARARLHGGRGARGGLVGSTSRTRPGGRTCSASPSLSAWVLVRVRRAARLAPARRAGLRGHGGVSRRRLAGGRRPARPAHARRCRRVLGVGAVVLAVPWWAHRRRRAKVRVQRTLAAWPDISRAIGLPGSQVMSADVDLWGWRARLRLARGQTIADVTARIPAIESALGTFRGAVRVYPTRDDKANRCELRVLGHRPARRGDPVARAVRPVHHRTRRPRAVRGRRAVPRAVPAPARAVRRHDRVGQERRPQRRSWAPWPPARTWSSGPST